MLDTILRIVQQATELPLEIDERKLDFLLGEIEDSAAAAKSKQRGYDFVHRLGYNRSQLRDLLEQQIRLPGLLDRVISVRENQLGGPLLNVQSRIQGLTNRSGHLASSWEVKDQHIRFVTAWVKIDR